MSITLETGDLVLVNAHPPPSHWMMALFDAAIQYFTRSVYSHVAIVLRDPPFVAEKGLYVWESGWEYGACDPQDGRCKLGVQVTPWASFVANNTGQLYIRKRSRSCPPITDDDLNSIHATVYGTPYDTNPLDWMLAIWRKDLVPQKTDRFWCSALVAYILVRLGVLAENVDWSIVRPADLSSQSNSLVFLERYETDTHLIGNAL